jgi:hypothetical protein
VRVTTGERGRRGIQTTTHDDDDDDGTEETTKEERKTNDRERVEGQDGYGARKRGNKEEGKGNRCEC